MKNIPLRILRMFAFPRRQVVLRHYGLPCPFFLLAFEIAGTAFAQDYAVDWHKIAAGGGTSSNSQYTVTGTIGQPDTAHVAGDSFTVDGGFWAFAAAVQGPGAPHLTIQLTSTNTIGISWPSSSAGFVLQSSSSLVSTNWSTLPSLPSDDGTTKTLIVPPILGYQFFRLIKP